MSGHSIRFLACLGVVLAAYLLSGAVSTLALDYLFGIECDESLAMPNCSYPADGTFDHRIYFILAASTAAVLAVFRCCWHGTAAYPFIATMAVIMLLTIGYDVAAENPVIHAPKIVNDTVNVLGFVIFASFLLALFLLRRGHLSLLRVAGAAATSYAVKLAAMASFLVIQPGVGGATELFLLYVAYAFGAFTIHIMTISNLIGGTPLPEEQFA